LPEPYQDGIVLGCFAAAALALIWLISSWSLRPLIRASQQARAIGPQDRSRRISRDGLPAEITPLVEAVNGALDRMADAVESERRFTENAAHELRTPLAVLGLRLQRARQADPTNGVTLDWPAVGGDLARMNRLVSQLLDLARKEHAGRVDAAEKASMVLPLAEADGRALVIDLPEALPVRGRADDLRDALRNLLENAVFHGQGTITVADLGGSDPLHVGVAICDDGAGIAAGLEDAVFERFHKGHRSDGSGLGLAIVREVIRGHGGTIGFVPGPCCRVEIHLPPG
jgi:two-component system sensor histidine kinase QseC